MSKYERSRGQAVFDEVYAGDLGALPPAGTAPFIDHMLETLFAAVWSDPTLTIRDRRLLLLGALSAQGDEAALGVHLRAAVKRGELSPAQLQALAIFVTQYVGYPRGSRLLRVINEVTAGSAPVMAASAPR
jgi:4-carboxymuconolactone decarboxylase